MLLSEEGVIILYTPNDDRTKAELKREVTSEVAQLEAKNARLKFRNEQYQDEVIEKFKMICRLRDGLSLLCNCRNEGKPCGACKILKGGDGDKKNK